MHYNFGEKIRSVRERRSLTLREVAEIAGVSESLVSQIERNRVSPAIDTLLALADALGICRGIQLFNVLLGGALYQDLPAQFTGGAPTHEQRPPYDRPRHGVRIKPESPLHRLLRTDTLMVNSSHHQGIEKLSPELIPMAAAEDGLIEAVCMKGASFVWAVQWHPEMSPAEESSGKLFGAFLDACRQGGLGR
jgi:putative glutamine amidotransferase